MAKAREFKPKMSKNGEKYTKNENKVESYTSLVK